MKAGYIKISANELNTLLNLKEGVRLFDVHCQGEDVRVFVTAEFLPDRAGGRPLPELELKEVRNG